MKQAPGNTHTKRALFELRQRIVEGDLPGGTRLYEVAMAEELQISRTPIREAMSRLAEEGLLERASSGGFQVRSFTLSDVIDAIELRGILEGTAARMAAERGVKSENLTLIKSILLQLDDCFPEPGGNVDFDAYSELNAAFHDELATLCQSEILYRELERAKSLPFASPSAFLPDKLDISAFSQSLFIAQEQHRMLVQAIEAREGARAEAIAREHARIARNNLEFVLNEGSDLIAKLPSLAIVVD
ncbi:MAG: GntR family transcriptional regulator [Paracoccaceae bacterium]